MQINTDSLISMTEANQNFSKVARIVDEKGTAVILKNNVPKYIITEYSQYQEAQLASDEDVKDIATRIINKNRKAFEELTK